MTTLLSEMDDDVEITDVNDDDLVYQMKEQPLKNQDLNSLSQTGNEILKQEDWTYLVSCCLCFNN